MASVHLGWLAQTSVSSCLPLHLSLSAPTTLLTLFLSWSLVANPMSCAVFSAHHTWPSSSISHSWSFPLYSTLFLIVSRILHSPVIGFVFPPTTRTASSQPFSWFFIFHDGVIIVTTLSMVVGLWPTLGTASFLYPYFLCVWSHPGL